MRGTCTAGDCGGGGVVGLALIVSRVDIAVFVFFFRS